MIKAKKHFGQNFLNRKDLALKITESLTFHNGYNCLLEIGPGMGILTDLLINQKSLNFKCVEIDPEAVNFLRDKYFSNQQVIIEYDFLKLPLEQVFYEPFGIIGNFPYNISSQILFKVLDNKNLVPELVGMFQREVALRIASNPGNKNYGILSVLMQAYYDVKYLFTLEPADFTPAPKIHSGVISCRIKKEEYFPKSSDFELRNVVKAAFNQRRKKISNALLPIAPKTIINQLPYMDLRAEQLSWQMFDEIALKIEAAKRLSVY